MATHIDWLRTHANAGPLPTYRQRLTFVPYPGRINTECSPEELEAIRNHYKRQGSWSVNHLVRSIQFLQDANRREQWDRKKGDRYARAMGTLRMGQHDARRLGEDPALMNGIDQALAAIEKQWPQALKQCADGQDQACRIGLQSARTGRTQYRRSLKAKELFEEWLDDLVCFPDGQAILGPYWKHWVEQTELLSKYA